MITIRLQPAAVADITVRDADTHQPLANVDVWISDRDSTPENFMERQRVHGYKSWEVETRISHYDRPLTDEAGKMRVFFEPGKHRIGVGFQSYPDRYERVEPEGRNVAIHLGDPAVLEFFMRKRK